MDSASTTNRRAYSLRNFAPIRSERPPFCFSFWKRQISPEIAQNPEQNSDSEQDRGLIYRKEREEEEARGGEREFDNDRQIQRERERWKERKRDGVSYKEEANPVLILFLCTK